MKRVIIAVSIIGWTLFLILSIIGYLQYIEVLDTNYYVGLNLFFIAIFNVVVFIWLLYFVPDNVIANGFQIIKMYLFVVIPLFVFVKGYEWITDSQLIFSVQYRFVPLIFLIYPVYLWLYGFLRLRPNRMPGAATHTVVVALMFMVTLYIHGFFILLGGMSVTPVDVPGTDRELVLVESSFIFSSTHEVYQKKNALFIQTIYHHGTHTCDDGCITGHPEYFEWTWLDENTLKVSGNGSVDSVIYYFNESE
jgi:hypothetical protein